MCFEPVSATAAATTAASASASSAAAATAAASTAAASTAAAGTAAAGTAAAASAGMSGWAAAGLAASLAGAGATAYGAYQSGKAGEETMKYQSEVDKYNAEVAYNNSLMEMDAGTEEARRQRLKTAIAIGQQKAEMGASGIDISDGNALDIIADTAEMGELDALMIEYGAEKRAANYLTQSGQYSAQSAMDLVSGQNKATSGMINAAGTGLGGIGTSASRWSRYGGYYGNSGNLATLQE